MSTTEPFMFTVSFKSPALLHTPATSAFKETESTVLISLDAGLLNHIGLVELALNHEEASGALGRGHPLLPPTAAISHLY